MRLRCFILILVSIHCLYGFSETRTGKCGENVNYSLDMETGLLTIYGFGETFNFNRSDDYTPHQPWHNYRYAIRECIIMDGITSVGENMFYNCKKLASIMLPTTITKICDYAFFSAEMLSSCPIPTSVKEIGQYAFDGTAIEEVILTDSIKSIGVGAFNACSSLKRMVLPGSILHRFRFMFNRTTYSNPFSGSTYDYEYRAPKLNSLTITGDTINVSNFISTSVQNPQNKRGGGGYICYQPEAPDTLIISDVKYIKRGNWSLNQYSFLSDAGTLFLNISRADFMGNLYGFKNLRYLSCSFNDIVLLGSFFGNCDKAVVQYSENGKTQTYSVPGNLEEIDVAEGTTQIAYGCLSNFSMLKRITLPSTLNGVRQKAFYGCDGLTDIFVKRALPPVAYTETFEGVNLFSCKLHVPHGSKQYYEKAAGWKDFYFIEEDAPLTMTVVKSIEYGGEIVGLTSYKIGDKVSLEAIAHSGYIFSAWTEEGNILTTNRNLTFTADRNRRLIAVFVPVYNENFVQVTSNDVDVLFTWDAVDGASRYALVLYRDTKMTEVVEYLHFNQEGQPLTRASANHIQATVTNLSAETDLSYSIIAYADDNIVLSQFVGNFNMSDLSGLSLINSANTEVYEIFRVDGTKVRNVRKGINIIHSGNGEVRKILVK